jgi:16S rRNA processing protein RimM
MTNPPQRPTPEYLVLGEILRPHGVRGELRMRVLTGYPERINELEHVFLSRDEEGKKAVAYAVEHLRLHQAYGLLKLKGIDDRDQADRLRELYVLVDSENAIPLEEGEVYLYQIIGLQVVADTGEQLGILTDVLETGANDVYRVKSDTYGEILIPDIESTILDINLETNTMTVHLLDGLLPSPPKRPNKST